MKYVLSLLFLAGLAMGDPPDVDSPGVRAFRTSVYALVRRNCVRCHGGLRDGPAIGPSFAVDDILASYQFLRRIVRFDNIPESRLVRTGGNLHCREYGIDCATDGAAIRLQIERWWEGEQRMPQTRLVSAAIRPASAPGSDPEAWIPMRFPIAELVNARGNAFLDLEIQRFRSGRPDERGAYRFRKPRIATSRSSLFVNDIRILVDGVDHPGATAFQDIHTTISARSIPREGPLPFPLLSTHTVIIPRERDADVPISVSFGSLVIGEEASCHSLETFRREILPVIERRDCYVCHSGGPRNRVGRSPARDRYNMAGSVERQCAQALQRGNPRNPGQSSFVRYAVEGLNGHPRWLPGQELDPEFTDWMRSEVPLPQRPAAEAPPIDPP